MKPRIRVAMDGKGWICQMRPHSWTGYGMTPYNAYKEWEWLIWLSRQWFPDNIPRSIKL